MTLAPALAVTATTQPSIERASTPLELRARDKAREFETVFLTTFVEQMQTGIETDGPFGGGHSEKVYRSLMAQEYAKSISNAGGVGLADHVYREIIAAQAKG